jgi:activating signal cointegrator 1
MKAITVWNPWARLLVTRQKRFETRSWGANLKPHEPLAIHAGRTILSLAKIEAWAEDIERCFAVADAFRCDEVHPKYLAKYLHREFQSDAGYVLGFARSVKVHKISRQFIEGLTLRERTLGDFRIGRFAWEMIDVVRLDLPRLANGKQKIWEWIP